MGRRDRKAPTIRMITDGPTLTELKIMYDHAKAQLDRAEGSRISNHQGYAVTLAKLNKVKAAYDKAIEKQIDNL